MQETPIIIHQHLVQKFMTLGKDFSNALALYTFYIYHAQQQKTNRPLATDSFTCNGLNWGIEKVKRIKRLLKDLKVIEVVQVRKYSYIHLFFIYTKKKIGEVLGKIDSPIVEKKDEIKKELKEDNKIEIEEDSKDTQTKAEPKPKTDFHLELEKNYISQDKIEIIRKTVSSVQSTYMFDPVTLAKWIVYLEKNKIQYNKSHIVNWLKKLNGITTIEQKEVIYNAINKKWKDFYLPKLKNSSYQKCLAKHLDIDGKYCDTLLDIDSKEGVYCYRFQNITIKIKQTPMDVFNSYQCEKRDPQSEPIGLKVMGKISEMIKRF